MRLSQALAIVACVGLLSAASPLNLRHVSAAPVKDNVTTFRIVIGPATKVADASQVGMGSDDSKWGRPVTLSPDIAACVSQQTGSWPRFPAFWGADTSHGYWMHQHFSLPKARSYSGSVFDIRAYARFVAVFLNGSLLGGAGLPTYHSQTAVRVQLDPTLLHAGDNLLEIQFLPQTSVLGARGVPCNAASFILTALAQDAAGSVSPSPAPVPTVTAVPTPIPSGPTVTPSFPPDNAIVTGTTLPLRWQSFRHAAAYLVHIWLVKADAGQAVTASTVATTAKTVLGVSTALSTARMLKGEYRWNIAALNAAGQLITVWSAPRSLQLT